MPEEKKKRKLNLKKKKIFKVISGVETFLRFKIYETKKNYEGCWRIFKSKRNKKKMFETKSREIKRRKFLNLWFTIHAGFT